MLVVLKKVFSLLSLDFIEDINKNKENKNIINNNIENNNNNNLENNKENNIKKDDYDAIELSEFPGFNPGNLLFEFKKNLKRKEESKLYKMKKFQNNI